MATIGVLHPGAMGAAVAGALQQAGHDVSWVVTGRSDATRRRAADVGLHGVPDLATLVGRVDVLVSICPPHAAVEVASAVRSGGFQGCYLDANAIAPATVAEVAEVLGADPVSGTASAGITFVDGGIVGGPDLAAGRTELVLSGEAAGPTAELLAVDQPGIVVLDDRLGTASALKMAFAAWSKGRAALLLGVRAMASAFDVDEALVARWERRGIDAANEADQALATAGRKGWRFAGEMEEIAATFASRGVPDGFHRAAAEVFAAFARDEDARQLGFDGLQRRLAAHGEHAVGSPAIDEPPDRR
ncbi:MAG: NAD(P)-dependent oxidoreductase [Nitriliruptoraceae bacterium]|nr:NAD(P)-dependent oxidoreductase [Nitriliruptoraceae bacterium]